MFRNDINRDEYQTTENKIVSCSLFCLILTLACLLCARARVNIKQNREQDTITPLIDDCANKFKAKNNNASLQNDKLMHTASESYCNVYISKRAIVDISCIDLLVKNIRIKYYDVDFRRKQIHTCASCVKMYKLS